MGFVTAFIVVFDEQRLFDRFEDPEARDYEEKVGEHRQSERQLVPLDIKNSFQGTLAHFID